MSRILYKKFRGFQKFQKSNFLRGKFFKTRSSIIYLSWDHMRYHKKIGPDVFSRFDRQTNRQAKYIYIDLSKESDWSAALNDSKNLNCVISISLQPDFFYIWYFKLWILLDSIVFKLDGGIGKFEFAAKT